MKFIKDNFLSLIILVVVAVMLLQRCGGDRVVEKPTITIVRDTTYLRHDSTILLKPQIISSELTPVAFWDTVYLPSNNKDSLLDQYMKAVNELLAKNYYKKRFPLDTLGSYAEITDTVQKNVITGRSFHYDLKTPVITNTITTREQPKSQLYIGGQLQGSQDKIIRQINAGLLLKNKRDQIYGITAGMDYTGKAMFGIQSYWKISFKKK